MTPSPEEKLKEIRERAQKWMERKVGYAIDADNEVFNSMAAFALEELSSALTRLAEMERAADGLANDNEKLTERAEAAESREAGLRPLLDELLQAVDAIYKRESRMDYAPYGDGGTVDLLRTHYARLVKASGAIERALASEGKKGTPNV